MSFIIIFLLPSIIGFQIYIHFIEVKSYFNLILKYLTFLLLSNFLAMFISTFIKEETINLITYAENNYLFSTKYIAISIFINIILSIIFVILKKYVTFEIEVENGRKNKKK